MKTYQPKSSIFQKKEVIKQMDSDIVPLWENKGRLSLLASMYASLHGQVKK